jgi:hypothetical protein
MGSRFALESAFQMSFPRILFLMRLALRAVVARSILNRSYEMVNSLPYSQVLSLKLSRMM